MRFQIWWNKFEKNKSRDEAREAWKAARRQHCHAQKDGECDWKNCPQLKDYQNYCPLATGDDKFYGEEI